MGKRLTTKEFIKRSKKIHGNKYDYSKTKFKISKTKVTIMCKKCDKVFKQLAHNHLNGYGCAECGNQRTKEKNRLTTEEFIKKAKKVHGDKYDYSKVKYQKAKEKVIIICKKCNKSFKQKAYSHLEGYGCRACQVLNITLTTEEFIKRAKKIHGNKYNYSKIDYKQAKEKIRIICKKCNKTFRQTSSAHLNKRGCPYCVGKQLTRVERIKQFKKTHGDKYDYSEMNYVNRRTKIKIICKSCNKSFTQTPGCHLNGNGCHYCKKKNESEVEDLLKKYFINFTITSYKLIYKYVGADKKLHKRFCDFYLEKDNRTIVVEYDGEQHYKPIRFGGINQKRADNNFKRQQYIDKKDIEYCSSHNILLWRIKYNEDKEKSILNLKSNI